jgi:hypothetical protein
MSKKYPYLTKNGRKDYLHRHILEDFYGRRLEKNEHVYHINGDSLDNSISNLVIIKKNACKAFTVKKKMIENRIDKFLFDKEVKLEQWGAGEWVDEPDFITFFYKYYECCICRHAIKIRTLAEGFKKDSLSMGHLCGYIQLPKNHPFLKMEMFDIPLEVHGGISYSEKGYIGFHCGHMGAGDYIPSLEKIRKANLSSRKPVNWEQYSIFKSIYRNVEFVINEIISVVEQLEKLNE